MDIRSINTSNKMSTNIKMEMESNMEIQKLYFESDYPRDLIFYVEGLIEFEGYPTGNGIRLEVEGLPIKDLQKFAAYLISHKSKQKEGWDWLMDSLSREELANHFAQAFLVYLPKKNDILSAFSEDMIAIAIHEFKQEMQDIIDLICDRLHNDSMTESGHKLLSHDDNGEKFWAKVA